MKGSISVLPNGRFYVSWYDAARKKTWKIYRYKGEPMYDRRTAEKLRSVMQNDVENNCFRIEKYTRGDTDVIPYMREWLNAIVSTITPGTKASYRNAIEIHLAPFFQANPLSLNDIQYDNLCQLLVAIKRSGAGKLTIMKVLHKCLVYAKKSGRIVAVPEFPERSMYQIVEQPIEWLSSSDQKRLIEAIPIEHQPVFWFLKYHLRRPGEAMALRKEDFDGQTFIIQRGISSKRLVNRTKTGEVHVIPCVSDFEPYIRIEEAKQKHHGIISPFFFVYPDGRTKDKRYTHNVLGKLWHMACEKTGISIDLYSGLRKSTASQMINEDGYSLQDVQVAGDWAALASVKRYAKTESSRVKALLERKTKILRMGSPGRDRGDETY